MNEMDGRHSRYDSSSDWSIRTSTFTTNGKRLPGVIGSLHDTPRVADSDEATGEKEWKERWAERIILGGSAAGLVYGIILIVQRCIL